MAESISTAAASIIKKTVLLATSWAPLLSGNLHQCYNVTDSSCSGGIAAFRAMLRHHTVTAATYSTNNSAESIHLQLLDKNNAFVHMHPLGLSVNRLILRELMGLSVFASSPALLLQNKLDYEVSSQDISLLQTHDMPFLLTNVGVPPSNSWYPFVEAVHFDEDTGLAVMSVSKSGDNLNVPQVESTLGGLRYVRKINEENGCVQNHDTEKLSEYFTENGSRGLRSENSSKQCWLPIVYHSDDGDEFLNFLEGMFALPAEHRPAAIIDTGGNSDEYHSPVLDEEYGIWIASHDWNSQGYFHHKLDISYPTLLSRSIPKLVGMEFVSASLSPLPDEMKDEVYAKEILALRTVADEALENNPVVGYSDFMPVTRGTSKYRPCKSGECPIGNLYTDAARWYAKADVAFITSGGVRGPGWSAGGVHVSDIWNALPFPNTLCEGYMNGVHLFQLLNYSMSVSTFQGHDTDDGGRLLQISGMKITYNTKLSQSRIISIDIHDQESNEYKPIDRLRTYKFATDSYLCSAYKPYPSLLGSDSLVVEGEEPGKVGSALFQEMLASYLNATTSSDAHYDTNILSHPRQMNDTNAMDVLNLVQTEDGCEPGMYWKADIQTCLMCPVDVDVSWRKQNIEFEAVSQQGSQIEEIVLKNHELFPVAVIPKRLPKWLTFISEDERYAGTDSPTFLEPGESLFLSMQVDPSELEEGTVYRTIGFGVIDGGDYLGCVGQDATFEFTTRVNPTEQLNQLGSLRIVGFAAFGIIAFTSIAFAAFVFYQRRQPAVRALQPIFLETICFGVFVLGSTLIPLSIDDEITSQKGCDITCMALPWLLSLGFSIAISALFAKLWRINRLFSAGLRRVQVTPKDVATPMLVLLVLNVALMLTCSLVDPLVWQRFEVGGQTWNTFGVCVSSSGSSANPFLITAALMNGCALVLAIIQAWKARKISEEYSEAKSIGIAIYSWLQLLIVGVPVLFLIDKNNTKPRYFIFVSLTFLLCMSMLLIIFVPLLMQIKRARQRQKTRQIVCNTNDSFNNCRAKQNETQTSSLRAGVGSVRISGLNLDMGRLKNEMAAYSIQHRDINEREGFGGAVPSLPVTYECSKDDTSEACDRLSFRNECNPV